METLRLNYCSELLDIVDINPSFAVGKLWIAYAGLNRNGSYISEDAFERALPTLKNVPLVANYNVETDEIGGHDIDLVRNKEGNLMMINITEPVGVVPESSVVSWEERDDSGIMRKYIVCDVILWKRQAAFKHILEHGSVAHSMEITVKQSATTSDGILNIKDFVFTALCLLGEDHTPCFEGSELQVFSLDSFKEQFEEMMADYKATILNQQPVDGVDIALDFTEKEDSELDKKLEVLEKYGLKAEDLDFDLESISVEDLEIKLSENFSLNLNDLLDEIHGALGEVRVTDPWGYEVQQYWFLDIQDSEVIVYDVADRWRIYGIPFEMNGDAVVLKFEEAMRKKTKYENFEGAAEEHPAYFEKYIQEVADNFAHKLAQVEEEANTVKSELDQIKPQYENFVALAKEQEVKQKDELLSKFEKELAESEEFALLKEKKDQYDFAALEKECFFILGKKKAVFSSKQEKGNAFINIPAQQLEQETPIYGGLFDKYGRK